MQIVGFTTSDGYDVTINDVCDKDHFMLFAFDHELMQVSEVDQSCINHKNKTTIHLGTDEEKYIAIVDRDESFSLKKFLKSRFLPV